MFKVAAILLLLTASAQAGGDPYRNCGGGRYLAMQNDLLCASPTSAPRIYRGARYFPVFVQTSIGLGVSLCWGHEIELDGQLWCKLPRVPQ